MASESNIPDEELWEFVDGGLSDLRRADIEARMEVDQNLRARITSMRRENAALSQLGASILDAPVPERLRNAVRAGRRAENVAPSSDSPSARRYRTSRGGVTAIAAAVLLSIGFTGGWFLRPLSGSEEPAFNRMLRSVVGVSTFYSADTALPLDFLNSQMQDLQVAISRLFGRDISPPDLTKLGYRFDGARLLPFDSSSLCFFQFMNDENRRVSVMFWPTEERPVPIKRFEPNGGGPSRYWVHSGLAFVVTSDGEDLAADEIAAVVFEYYNTQP